MKINRHVLENALFKSRSIVCLIILCIFSLILIGRLVYLQLMHNKFYSTLSRHNLLSVIPIQPNRGLIYDRHGVLLAKNIPTYTLSLIPESIPNIKKTITQLQKLLPITDSDVKRFNHIRSQYRPFEPIPLKFKLSEQEADLFYVNQYRLPGVIIQTRMMRYYPLGSAMSDVLGYVGRINQKELQKVDTHNYSMSDDIGKMGIEKYYEKILHGKVGSEEAEIDATGHIVRILKKTPPTPGKNLYLSIDSRLQLEAEAALGKESGAVVIIQPSTGEILALVSHPSFDPNPFVSGISQQQYEALLNSPGHPLYNRAIRGQFASGSTIKPIYALAGLNEGVITPDYRIYDRGWFQLPNTEHVYHDWKRGGHGWVDVSTAIKVSCDTYFYNLAVNMGIARIDKVLQDFGFGKLTGIDMPEEVPGLVPTPDWKRGAQGHPWYTGDTIEAGIGQGFFLVTPLQLAQAVAIIADRGIRLKPHLLIKTVDEHNNATMLLPDSEKPVVMAPDAWSTVIHAMQEVVDGRHGTAAFFGRHPLFSVAAKTGTAQVYGHDRNEYANRTDIPKRLRNNHLFIAFAPVDHPQIAMALVVEHSAMADRIGGKIFNYYFKNLTNDKPK